MNARPNPPPAIRICRGPAATAERPDERERGPEAASPINPHAEETTKSLRLMRTSWATQERCSERNGGKLGCASGHDYFGADPLAGGGAAAGRGPRGDRRPDP